MYFYCEQHMNKTEWREQKMISKVDNLCSSLTTLLTWYYRNVSHNHPSTHRPPSSSSDSRHRHLCRGDSETSTGTWVWTRDQPVSMVTSRWNRHTSKSEIINESWMKPYLRSFFSFTHFDSLVLAIRFLILRLSFFKVSYKSDQLKPCLYRSSRYV